MPEQTPDQKQTDLHDLSDQYRPTGKVGDTTVEAISEEEGTYLVDKSDPEETWLLYIGDLMAGHKPHVTIQFVDAKEIDDGLLLFGRNDRDEVICEASLETTEPADLEEMQ